MESVSCKIGFLFSSSSIQSRILFNWNRILWKKLNLWESCERKEHTFWTWDRFLAWSYLAKSFTRILKWECDFFPWKYLLPWQTETTRNCLSSKFITHGSPSILTNPRMCLTNSQVGTLWTVHHSQGLAMTKASEKNLSPFNFKTPTRLNQHLSVGATLSPVLIETSWSSPVKMVESRLGDQEGDMKYLIQLCTGHGRALKGLQCGKKNEESKEGSMWYHKDVQLTYYHFWLPKWGFMC